MIHPSIRPFTAEHEHEHGFVEPGHHDDHDEVIDINQGIKDISEITDNTLIIKKV